MPPGQASLFPMSDSWECDAAVSARMPSRPPKSSDRDEKPAKRLAAQQADRSFVRGPGERILQNSTNEPGMCMKTKDRVEKLRSRADEKLRSQGRNATATSSGSPGMALSASRPATLDSSTRNRTNEPGMSMKTKDEDKKSMGRG